MEGKLGRFIHEVRLVYSDWQEERRIRKEREMANRRFQQVLEEFGGTNGTEVTVDQISRYLAADLETAVAGKGVTFLIHPEWSRLPETSYLKILKNAQDFQTPKGKIAARAVFEEEQRYYRNRVTLFRESGFISDADNNERLAKACATAISVLFA